MNVKVKLVDLGSAIGKIKTWNDPRTTLRSSILIIAAPASDDGQFYTPAESVTIFGSDSMIALRDALLETFPIESKEEKR